MRAANAAKNKSESIVMSARKENVELSEGFKQMLRDFEDVYNNDKTYIQHFERKRLDEIAKGR
jgi:spore germination protein YaaH